MSETVTHDRDNVHSSQRRILQAGHVLAGLGRSVRPWQWYKQLVCFLGLVFSLNATNLDAWLDVTAGAGAFCAVAGAMYLVNDVSDREEDRAHPTKKDRPIASGQVPVPVAMAAAVVLAVTGLGGAWLLEPLFFAVVGLYVAQNVAYNTVLRDVLFVDVMIIATGFVLRAVGGTVLVGVHVSPWLILCTFLAALLLGFGKRKSELDSLDEDQGRATMDGYQPQLVQVLLGSVASTLLLAYGLYTFFATSPLMMATLPFAFYAVFRYLHLVWTEDMQETERLFFDKGMVANMAIWGVLVGVLLYAPIPTVV